jgi:hypothetical protein
VCGCVWVRMYVCMPKAVDVRGEMREGGKEGRKGCPIPRTGNRDPGYACMREFT